MPVLKNINVIDGKDLSIHVLPNTSTEMEAMFTNKSDRLLSISFDPTNGTARILGQKPAPYLREL